MAELKPCPFCGGKAREKTHISGKWKKSKWFFVECSVCGSRTTISSVKEETEEAWNRRAEDGKRKA